MGVLLGEEVTCAVGFEEDAISAAKVFEKRLQRKKSITEMTERRKNAGENKIGETTWVACYGSDTI
jgi:hypothetical protein